MYMVFPIDASIRNAEHGTFTPLVKTVKYKQDPSPPEAHNQSHGTARSPPTGPAIFRAGRDHGSGTWVT